MNLVLSDPNSDPVLWTRVLAGETRAFEILVERYQALVSGVAYNACGNLALSEDVTQETFWVAWRDKSALGDPLRLRAWLCGIARNLGHNARRRSPLVLPEDSGVALSAPGPSPVDQAISREEEHLVWSTLEEIPEPYRETLILYYREECSVNEVAAALEVSPDAVKQRLSRGRALLRDRVADLVEGTLRRSRPGKGLTMAIMTGLTSLSVGSGTAMAADASLLGAATKVALGAGMGGAVAGTLGGLAGAWVGTTLPARLAPTTTERDYLKRTGRRTLLVSLIYTLLLALGSILLIGQVPILAYFGILMGLSLLFGIYITVESVTAARMVKQLRAQGGPPNDDPMHQRAMQMASRYKGRVFRSQTRVLGIPLIDIQVSDPMPSPAGQGPLRAWGWIAIGDDARGILVGIGNTARGFLAIGGRAFGVISFGGIALGGIAIGGVSCGVVALGGLALGGLALGGLGIGYQAAGGGAIAWDVAVGGGAVAYEGAFGGLAIAKEHALGGEAMAAHANDAAARALLEHHPLRQGMNALIAHPVYFWGFLVLGILPPVLVMPTLMYRRSS